MELENKGGVITSNEEEDDVHLPGFRFHPTDEELVGFYLRRKVEKRPISIKLIEQVDIYKYDPWDLPKSSINGGDKEWYFFCKRGRKYRNSIRPNRVTSSGFWKATGIDKPIYSSGHVCIGLKKSLVYYRGTAGKGTKTDWMMHEFRLPSTHAKRRTSKDMDAECFAQEAEVWTLCRILKRHISYRKGTPADWQVGAKRSIISPEIDATSQISSDHENRIQKSNYISFSAPMNIRQKDEKPYSNYVESITQAPFPACSFLSHPICADVNELLRHADWEDLRSIVDHTAVAASINSFYL